MTHLRILYWDKHLQRGISNVPLLYLFGGIDLKDNTPLYLHSASYAYEHNELDVYRVSRQANITCRDAIEQAIADNYRNNRLSPECVQQVLKQFDYSRIFYVLANTVRQKNEDGRISRDNKAWAQTIPVCEDRDSFGSDRNCYFIIDRSHTGLMDLFLTQARRGCALAQEKPSARDSLNKNAGQQAACSDKPKTKKELAR